MPFTAQELMVAVFGSAGVIGGLVALATFIAARRDASRARREQHESMSVEMQRVRLDNERFGSGVWESVAREREVEISHLKAEVIHLKQMIVTARKTLVDAEKALNGLRVAKVPDEIVEIIERKLVQVKEVIATGKDQLG